MVTQHIIDTGIQNFHFIHSKKRWVVLSQFWVKYGQTSRWVTFLNYIFNPMLVFVHI